MEPRSATPDRQLIEELHDAHDALNQRVERLERDSSDDANPLDYRALFKEYRRKRYEQWVKARDLKRALDKANHRIRDLEDSLDDAWYTAGELWEAATGDGCDCVPGALSQRQGGAERAG